VNIHLKKYNNSTNSRQYTGHSSLISFQINNHKEVIKLKATGIVRRIDDLGRIVIPKEIRRTLRIREGDPLEIYTEASGEVIFKKYSPMGEMSPFAAQYADVLSRALSMPVLIADRDHIIAVSGIPKREFMERRITIYLEDLMESRKYFSTHENEDKRFLPVEGMNNEAEVAFPIISGGDVSGSVVVLKSEKKSNSPEIITKLAKISAEFLGKQMED
jgi:AbrB family transcriptional regulator, stage V sporulation protein T